MRINVWTAWIIAACLLGGCVTPRLEPVPGGWGKYSGPVRTEWVGPRKMKILEDASFIEPNGREWKAPQGALIDGASIPPAFWSLIGGPFEGDYREASVFHDVACEDRKANWQDTHSMFYRAMRASGVGPKKAKTLFAAVWHYGDRWKDPPKGVLALILPKAPITPLVPATRAEAQEMQNWIEQKNPRTETIEDRAVRRPGVGPLRIVF